MERAFRALQIVPSAARVTLTEYADFGCPRSARAGEAVTRLRESMGDRLHFEFRHFPSADVRSRAFRIAEALEAARAQGAFQAMHDLLFERQRALASGDVVEGLVQCADDLELDVRKFQQELCDGTYIAVVEQDLRQGMRRGVECLPAFFVNDRRLDFPWPWSEESLGHALRHAIREATRQAA